MKSVRINIQSLSKLIFFTFGLIACSSTSEDTSRSSLDRSIIYVDVGVESGDGYSWETAFSSVQDALDVSVANSEIWVAKGVYYPEKKVLGDSDRAKSFHLKPDVKLYAGFSGGETQRDQRDWKSNKVILSGDLNRNDDSTENSYADNSFHVVTGNGTTTNSLLDGFYITGGNADAEEWPHDGGGGMNNEEGNLTIINCTFYNNQGFADGGGVRVWGESNPKIINTVFRNNKAVQEGGGLMNGPESQPRVVNCLFENNFSGEDGGGMYNNITSNQIVANCIFKNNKAGLTGGGMYNVNGSAPLIVNCTFISNQALESGGAISNRDSNPTLINSILWSNTAPVSLEINNLRSSPEVSFNIISGGFQGDNNLDLDPMLTEDLMPKPGSPVIDKGQNSILPEFLEHDFIGNSRLLGERVDLGAFEAPE